LSPKSIHPRPSSCQIISFSSGIVSAAVHPKFDRNSDKALLDPSDGNKQIFIPEKECQNYANLISYFEVIIL